MGQSLTILLGCRDVSIGTSIASQLSSTATAIETLELDVTSSKSVKAAAAAVAERGAKLDVIVNNAGVLLERDGVDLASIMEPTLAVNLDGVVSVTEAFAPLVGDGGQIIYLSSGAGTRAAGKLSAAIRSELSEAADSAQLRAIITRLATEATQVAHAPGETPIYALSKVAVNFYTQLVARSNGRIRANACSPGFCRTEIAGPDADYSKREPKDAALGADVVLKLLNGQLGSGVTGKFFKEGSKPGTLLEEARSAEEGWVAT